MSDAVDLPEGKARPLGPGDPEDTGPGLSQMGSTLAERKAAREKLGAEQEAEEKAVEKAENKSVPRKRASRK